jgi:outer membrane protein OmpA-like peptidoglycan-associated protein
MVLAVAFLAPANAQQDSSNQTAPATQNSADQTMAPLSADRHEGFWGKINPMARKKYVQRQMEPIRGRVNELDELTAANSKAIKDVDARAQEGIRLASARANEADLHAVDAGNRAQAANQTAEEANARLQTVSHVVGNIDRYQQVSDTEIRLRPGQVTLSKKATDAIDLMADGVKGQNAYLFEVHGYANGSGAAAIENSQRMAESVMRYLVIKHDIPVYRIYLLGMGNAPVPASAEGNKTGHTRGGIVEIALLKNPDIEQLAASSTSSGISSANVSSQGGASGSTAPSSPQPSATNSLDPQQPASEMNPPASPPPSATPPPTQP